MDRESTHTIPVWVWGALVALLLIIISSRGRLVGNPALSQQFALQPTPDIALPLPDLQIGNLAPDLQAQAESLLRQIGMGNSGRPLEPLATTPRLRIEITELRPEESGLRVIGTVTNVSTTVVTVPISAFELRDSTGASYIAGGGASAPLQPGEHTPLELSVPLPPGRGLLLITRLPPDPPAEQKLIASES